MTTTVTSTTRADNDTNTAVVAVIDSEVRFAPAALTDYVARFQDVTFRAHRVMLDRASNYFRTILAHTDGDNEGVTLPSTIAGADFSVNTVPAGAA